MTSIHARANSKELLSVASKSSEAQQPTAFVQQKPEGSAAPEGTKENNDTTNADSEVKKTQGAKIPAASSQSKKTPAAIDKKRSLKRL
jgi:hypothetical protein